MKLVNATYFDNLYCKAGGSLTIVSCPTVLVALLSLSVLVGHHDLLFYSMLSKDKHFVLRCIKLGFTRQSFNDIDVKHYMFR